MRKLIILLSILALLLSACRPAPMDEKPEPTDEESTEVERVESTVDFYDPVEWDFEDILVGNEEHFESTMPDYYIKNDDFEGFKEFVAEYNDYWKTGTFLDGPYEGQTLARADLTCEGPCPVTFYRYAVDIENNEWTLLTPYSDGGYESYPAAPPYENQDDSIYIKALELPEELNIYESTSELLYDEFAGSTTSEYFDPGEQLSDYNEYLEVYKTDSCLYAVMPDGLAARYMMVPNSFVESDTEDIFAIRKELSFESIEGESVTKTYSVASGGCGFGFGACLSTYTPTSEELSKLEIVGTLGSDEVYFPYEYSTEEPEDYSTLDGQLYLAYQQYITRLEYSDEEAEPLSMEDFLADNNYFFMRLEDDSFVEVYNADYEPVGECGKPVIYLYPEDDTVVNVQVEIDEFTITIPDYMEDGWTVLAHPDSEITNLADGQTYPYLFWEGLQKGDVPLGPGWTLEKNEIPNKLPEVLKTLGLNETETADFMEFWLPKLMDEPGEYVEFNFVGTRAFNEIAPLSIYPMPDQVIRIFMVYQGTNKAGFPVPEYCAPPRYGFTVVEWGGLLR